MRKTFLTAVGALSLATAFTGIFSGAADARELVPCAEEGGYCYVPYPTRVVYGARGRFTSRDVGGRGIPCRNASFGDPAVGVPKHCAYEARGGWGGGEGYRAERRYDDDYRPRRRHRYDD